MSRTAECEGVSHVDARVRAIQAEEMANPPEVGCLMCSRNREEAGVDEGEW